MKRPIAIDLPLKVLVWQDDQGQVQMAWNSADYLTQRHGLDPRGRQAAGRHRWADRIRHPIGPKSWRGRGTER